jgi:hypothetical protein
MNTIEPSGTNQNDDTAHGRKDSEVPAKISIERSGGPRTSERANRSGRPRTRRGKNVSSKNSIKHGFFSKDVISGYRLDPAARNGYLQLVKDLCADWNPVGASEFIQIELMAAHLVQYWSFRRFERALVLAKITPHPDALYEQWELRIRMESGPKMPEEDIEAEIKGAEMDKEINERSKGAIDVCEETHNQVHRWKSEFPPIEHFDKLQRYENHILRNYYRAMSELERQQKVRLGEKVPPRVIVELQND